MNYSEITGDRPRLLGN